MSMLNISEPRQLLAMFKSPPSLPNIDVAGSMTGE